MTIPGKDFVAWPKDDRIVIDVGGRRTSLSTSDAKRLAQEITAACTVVRGREEQSMWLKHWARKNKIGYRTALRLFHAGKLPCKAMQLPTGSILVFEDDVDGGVSGCQEQVIIYGRVSSAGQKNDLVAQMGRLRDFCSAKGLQIKREVTDIGSGLNGKRPGLINILSRERCHIVVEHRDRLSRFGVPYIQACLAAAGRKIIVLNESEYKDDLVQDFVDVVTCMCARIYGRRAAKNRAKKAIEASQKP